ncbi:hypothetical protein K4U66_11255 [Staphylococcus epidermidis]|nr:hypothetical protein [Staphylococcus epidermidis]MCE7294656.1 hypothetical protein [Campylobacter coli]KAB2177423.1 hypothetical protein F9B26_11855 [Staphylococcus epidermidis]MBF9280403.1 hypothetical protein [Staphylococcus epidermidis]MCG1364642.1 hypothetical protein [Staphylococcus epidermidis]MCG1523993.1 hypothetical protein [Staphylococcus epidermidis]
MSKKHQKIFSIFGLSECELNDYLLELTMNENKVTKKDFEEFLCSIRNVPEIPNRQVNDILEGYKNSD